MHNFEEDKKRIEDAFDQLHKAAHTGIDALLGKLEDKAIDLIKRAEAQANHPASGKAPTGPMPDKDEMIADIIRHREDNMADASVWREVRKRKGMERVVFMIWNSLPAEYKTAAGTEGGTQEPAPDGSGLMDGLFEAIKKQTGENPWPQYNPKDKSKKQDKSEGTEDKTD